MIDDPEFGAPVISLEQHDIARQEQSARGSVSTAFSANAGLQAPKIR